ncbi:S-layer homology domain-containing protein [Brevibacillus borstelensis]|uniref:S-layer homology domain-containing protein n=1 Tax=Brevibacillus borstelensis TaxID=45462 RepID=UPI0030BC1252
MKTLLVRSGSILLTASLLAPGSLAYGETKAALPVDAKASSAASPAMPASKGSTGQTVTAQADKAKISKEAAMKIASKFVSTAGFELNRVSFRSADPWRTFPEWTFSWVKKSKNDDDIELSYNVSINTDTGELTSFSSYDRNASKPEYANRISYDDARKKAEAFFSANVPAKWKETRLYHDDQPVQKTPLNSDSSYTFRFVRLVDDIPFPDNSVDIAVDSSGKVTNYSVSWNDAVTFESPGKMMSSEEAAELFRKAVKPTLSYTVPWEAQGENKDKPILIYANPFNFYLDEDGTPLTSMLKPVKPETEPVPVSGKPLSPRHSGQQLSQDAAVSLVDQVFGLKGFTLRSANYNEGDYRGNKSVWFFDFENKEKQLFASAAVDAATGDVFSFYSNLADTMKTADTKKEIDPKAIEKKAMDDLKKFAPTWANRLYLDPPQEVSGEQQPDTSYTVRFHRLANGVSAASGSAHLTYDKKSGELMSFNLDFGRESYPSRLGDHISADKAAEAWLKEAKPEAVYMLEELPVKPLEQKSSVEIAPLPERKAKLVYRMTTTPLEQPYFLDAASGEWRSMETGKTIELHRTPPSDLEGHKAEKELLLMYEYDALSLIDGKIMPEKEITRGEMIEMLMISLNQGRTFGVSAERKASFADVANTSKYFAAVEAAVDRGLLDRDSSSLKPDEKITREELADMLVRALGYRKLADYSNMFQSDLTDISKSKHRGAIVIVTTLGIMKSGGEFRPDKSVSRADAAIAFTGFLEARSKLEETPRF